MIGGAFRVYVQRARSPTLSRDAMAVMINLAVLI